MIRSLRLLPFTMLIAFLLLGLKVGEVVHDGRMLALSYTQAQAAPEEGKTEAKPADAKAPEATPAVTPPSASGDEDSDEPPPKQQFSQVEVDILQSLAKRRQELDDREKQIELKQNMLVATDQRINDKIDSLQKMKQQIEALLAQYNAQEDTKIRSLVKIYENMKPKDASRIFEDLDMPILLEVVDKMSERKVAPILAGMSPEKARNLTVQLAEQRKLRKPSLSAASPPAETPASAPDTLSPAPSTNPPIDNTAAPAPATPAAGQ